LNEERSIAIGNVLRADISGFVVASRIPEPDVPAFGTFVHAPIQQETQRLIGLVYDIRLQDDPFLRDLAATVVDGNPEYEEVIRDQREVRAVPVEISVAAVGYSTASGYHYGLPPQPPMILYRINVCTKDEVREFTRRPDFLRALLENRDVPTDELIARALERSANIHAEAGSLEREGYLLGAARYLARYLARDPLRLESILRRLG
jgi:hypothetical protein